MFNIKKDETKIQDLEKEIMKLKGCIRKQNEDDDSDLASSEFEFDFKALEAFSIERMCDNGRPHTVIGYVRSRSKEGPCLGQWLFYCSKDEHNKLVEKFRAYLKTKKVK